MRDRTTIPDEVRRFVLTSIPSVPYLEALLLLRGAPALTWNAALVSRRLYIGEAQSLELLDALAQAGIAAKGDDGAFVYAPTQELAPTIDALAQAYAKSLVEVTDLIHSRVSKHAQRFADAFRWKKDDS